MTFNPYTPPQQFPEPEAPGSWSRLERTNRGSELSRFRQHHTTTPSQPGPDSSMSQDDTSDEPEQPHSGRLQEHLQESHSTARRSDLANTQQGRSNELAGIGLLYRHIKLAGESMPRVIPGDAFHLPDFQEGSSVDAEWDSSRKVPSFMTENPNTIVTKDQLILLSELAWPFSKPSRHLDGIPSEPPAIWRELPKCKNPCKYVSKSGQVSYKGLSSCKLPWHPECHTSETRRLVGLDLPDLRNEESYREVWFVCLVPYPTHLTDWGIRISECKEVWASVLYAVNRQDGIRNHLHYRFMAVGYHDVQAEFHFKLMLKESHRGQADRAIEVIKSRLNALRTVERRYQKGENARFQLMANSMSHLIGFAPGLSETQRVGLLKGHVEALKGKHVFQCLGDGYKK